MCFLFPARTLTDKNIRRTTSLVISKQFGHHTGLATSEAPRELLRIWIPGPRTWNTNSEERWVRPHAVFLAAPRQSCCIARSGKNPLLKPPVQLGPFSSSVFFVLASHFTFFDFILVGNKQTKIQHIQELYISSRKVISVRVGILVNFFQVWKLPGT